MPFNPNAQRCTTTLVMSSAFVLAGCSTVTQSAFQTLALTATHQGQTVEPVCKLTNDHGEWDAKAPAMVKVRKSAEDLNVTCKQVGMPDGLLKAVSRAAGSMWGNMIVGGAIGAFVDHSNGKGYDYADRLPVKMGESVVINKTPIEQAAQAQKQP